MAELNRIVDESIARHIKDSPDELNRSLAFTLENKLGFAMGKPAKFRKAKRDFQKNYFTEVLTFSLGNVSKAASFANLDRRHIHRMCRSLGLEPSVFRKEMIKPQVYIKQNVQDIVFEKVEKFYDRKDDNEIYSKIPMITDDICQNIGTNIPTYDDALAIFEKSYFENVLSKEKDISRAAKFAGISLRSLQRKIKELAIA